MNNIRGSISPGKSSGPIPGGDKRRMWCKNDSGRPVDGHVPGYYMEYDPDAINIIKYAVINKQIYPLFCGRVFH